MFSDLKIRETAYIPPAKGGLSARGIGMTGMEVVGGVEGGGEGRHETYPYGGGRRRELEEGGGFADYYFFAVLVFGPDVEVDGGVVDVGDFCVVGQGVAVPDGGDEFGG